MSNDISRDLLNSIFVSKENCIVDGVTEKCYVPFLVNRNLSYHVDCILYANEMNMHSHLANKMQYDYLRHSVRSRKRQLQKWVRPIKESDIESIKLYFGYSTRKAQEVLQANVLSEDQIRFIRKQTQID